MVSLFPLPNVVFFPNTLLPLHIFEPRYRQMVADSISGDGLIAVVLLKKGWERDYEGNPPVHDTATLGQIVHAERLSDGRYNIVLHGLSRIKLRKFNDEKSYRRAEADMIPEIRRGFSAKKAGQLRRLLFESFARVIEPPHWGFTVFSAPHLDLGITADLIASSLPCDPIQKQRILEAVAPEERVEKLVSLLEGEEGKGKRIRVKQIPFVHELAWS